MAAFAGSPQRLHLACDPALQLPAADLAAIATIAREAISNALTHAFPEGRDGDIWLRLVEVEDRFRLTVRDNGIGMPDLMDDPASGRGRIAAEAQRLGGFARLGSCQYGGAEVLAAFPRDHAAP